MLHFSFWTPLWEQWILMKPFHCKSDMNDARIWSSCPQSSSVDMKTFLEIVYWRLQFQPLCVVHFFLLQQALETEMHEISNHVNNFCPNKKTAGFCMYNASLHTHTLICLTRPQSHIWRLKLTSIFLFNVSPTFRSSVFSVCRRRHLSNRSCASIRSSVKKTNSFHN